MINTPQTRISKRVAFCAAHHIPGAGKCEKNHGHNWVANITVDLVSGKLNEQGFITDVRDLKEAAFKYDHDDLNNYFEVPSTENVAQKIAEDALEICSKNNEDAVYIVNVHLIETENNTASASASNFKWSPPEDKTVAKAHAEETGYMFGAPADPSVGIAPTAKPTATRFIKRKITE